MKNKKIKAWALVNKKGNLVWLMDEPTIGKRQRIKKYHLEEGEKIVPCEIIIHNKKKKWKK